MMDQMTGGMMWGTGLIGLLILTLLILGVVFWADHQDIVSAGMVRMISISSCLATAESQ
jgi:hypothetical protein